MKLDLQFFGGRGSASSKGGGGKLTPITVSSDWMYKPMDDGQIFANPIKYAGNELSKEIVKNAHSFSYEATEEKIENVNLSSLKSVQAFVTEKGLSSPHKSDKEVYAIKYNGNLYLMDGNHRVAKAKLNGKKSYKMNVITIEKSR